MLSDDATLSPLSGPIDLVRAPRAELEAEVRAAAESSLVRALLEVIDGGLLVLNAHRQIVAVSLRGLQPGPAASIEEVLGQRTGDVLGCMWASERPEGCGASEACRTCGALKTIIACQVSGRSVEGECLVSTGSGAYELGVRAGSLDIDGRRFTVVTLADRSDERRRCVLEQAFLHDLANLVTPLSTTAHLLRRVPESHLRATAEKVAVLVRRLEGEVQAHRALLDAERGRLALDRSSVHPGELLRELETTFEAHPLTRARTLRVEPGLTGIPVETDPRLVLRILTNMVTNALEATPEGGTVRAWTTAAESATRWACAFHVHNPSAMPDTVARHVFQRSFSTKAKRGRGIGTYSMKLLGERYLGGEVGFSSTDADGTTFSLRLPERAP
ncbi:MAG: HAMP domain-containing sensor histidine kinase [Myxococcales bacterium]